MSLVVAIDGPAGAGKSTVAAALAERLAVPHVDTGAFYRAATLAVLRAGADPSGEDACVEVLSRVRIERRAGRTLLDGEDVEDDIRGPAVTEAVSAVSRHPRVRALLLPVQRRQVGQQGAVVEGRDAGTAVVPDATLKVWLTASRSERATRRAAQLGNAGAAAVAAHDRAIAGRDARDARQMARAPDAVEIDTTGRSVTSLVDEIARMARSRSATPGPCPPHGAQAPPPGTVP